MKSEVDCIKKIGNLIASVAFHFQSEKDLQRGIQELFDKNEIPYKREFHLNDKDIPDFFIEYDDVKIALEIKIGGDRNSFLRQATRYLKHESVTCLFAIGTPYWIKNIPDQILGKNIYCHRILNGL